MAKGNVNPNPAPNPGANPPASAPPTSGTGGGGPTGNSGFSMNDSSMQGLQNKAGDLGSRLTGISSGLRGLNFSGNALGPIGLFAVPALNASNDNAVSQADRGAKAFSRGPDEPEGDAADRGAGRPDQPDQHQVDRPEHQCEERARCRHWHTGQQDSWRPQRHRPAGDQRRHRRDGRRRQGPRRSQRHRPAGDQGWRRRDARRRQGTHGWCRGRSGPEHQGWHRRDSWRRCQGSRCLHPHRTRLHPARRWRRQGRRVRREPRRWCRCRRCPEHQGWRGRDARRRRQGSRCLHPHRTRLHPARRRRQGRHVRRWEGHRWCRCRRCPEHQGRCRRDARRRCQGSRCLHPHRTRLHPARRHQHLRWQGRRGRRRQEPCCVHPDRARLHPARRCHGRRRQGHGRDARRRRQGSCGLHADGARFDGSRRRRQGRGRDSRWRCDAWWRRQGPRFLHADGTRLQRPQHARRRGRHQARHVGSRPAGRRDVAFARRCDTYRGTPHGPADGRREPRWCRRR